MSSLEIAVLGLPVRFEADDPALLAVIAQSYQPWRAISPTGREPLHFTLKSGAVGGSDESVAVKLTEPRIALATRGLSGTADAKAGAASCVVALEYAQSENVLEALDTLLLFILTAHCRVPVHAAGVVFGDTLALLAGASGSGKSTLAAHALQRGHAVLSDDAVYVDTGLPQFWGFPRSVNVLAEKTSANARLRRGKWKRALDSGSSMVTGPLNRAALFVLRPGNEARVQPISRADALAELTHQIDGGFDRFREEMPAVIDVVTEGFYALDLSRDPEEALDAVSEVLSARQ